MKDQNMLKKFVNPLVKTVGVCFGAYIVMCVINAYAPEKEKNRFKKDPVVIKNEILSRTHKNLNKQK